MNQKVSARLAGRPARSRGKENSFASTRPLFSQHHSTFNSNNKTLRVVVAVCALPRTDQKPNSVSDWIRLICEACSHDTETVLDLARLMSHARRSLPYGSWSRLWQSGGLPFSKRKGEMLVVIGQGVGELDAQNSAQLPAAWNTLYYLACLGRGKVERLIKQGRIHPGLSLHAAQALLAEFRPGNQRTNSHSKLQRRLARFAEFVRANLKTWSPTEQEWAARLLTILTTEIQDAACLPSFGAQPLLEPFDRFCSTAQIPGRPSTQKL